MSLSPEDLTRYQALRDHVRNKLLPALVAESPKHVVKYLRLPELLDEGDALQREVARRLDPEVVAAAIRQHLCGMEGIRGIDREILESRNAALCELAQNLGLTL